MTDRFVALDVKKGDSFVLQVARGTETVTFLVDGGEHRKPFPPHQFRSAFPALAGVDVMVCTHIDSDHSKGLIDCLAAGLTTRELWIPYDWFEVAKKFLEDPLSFFSTLFKGVQKLSDEEVADLEDLIRKEKGNQMPDEGDLQENPVVEGWQRDQPDPDLPENLKIMHQMAMDGVDLEFYMPVPYKYRNFKLMLQKQFNSPIRLELFLALGKLAQRIGRLVAWAWRRKAKVIWFELDNHPKGQRHYPELEPLNCRVVLRPQSSGSNGGSVLIKHMALSTVNERALVFCAPGKEGRPPVLFSGDSNFDAPSKFDHRVPWTNGMLITTPHHGSQDNPDLAAAYGTQATKGIHSVWVRSDELQKTPPDRPDAWYTALPAQASRYCTACNHENAHRCLHFVVDSNQRWVPDPLKCQPPICTCNTVPSTSVSTAGQKKAKKSSSSQV